MFLFSAAGGGNGRWQCEVIVAIQSTIDTSQILQSNVGVLRMRVRTSISPRTPTQTLGFLYRFLKHVLVLGCYSEKHFRTGLLTIIDWCFAFCFGFRDVIEVCCFWLRQLKLDSSLDQTSMLRFWCALILVKWVRVRGNEG